MIHCNTWYTLSVKFPSRFTVIYFCLILAILQHVTAHAKTEGSLTEGLQNPGYHPPPTWFKNSFLDIRTDIEEATKAGKRVMLYFYQDGCPYCKKLLIDNFSQQHIANKTQANFDVIAINMWGDREVIDFDGSETSEKEFAVAHKVMFTPTLLLLDEQHKVALRINGYFAPNKFAAALDYVGQRHDAKMTFREYLKDNLPAPASGKLHQSEHYIKAPYQLDKLLKADPRPLLVLFEQRQCKACDELHLDILQRPASRALLQMFHVVLVDMWSDTPLTTPAGDKTTASRWANDLGVQYAPSLIFFDKKGAEAFRTEAYLKAFHIQSVFDYVLSEAYLKQPEFQRFIEHRAALFNKHGVPLSIME